MADKDTPPQYDAAHPDTSAKSKSVIVTLNRRIPGKISEDGMSMTMLIDDTGILEQRNDAITMKADATRKELLDLLFTRVKAHFKIDLVREPPKKPRGYSVFSMLVDSKRVFLVDEVGWEAARAWLDKGAVLQLDFAVPKKTSVESEAACQGEDAEESTNERSKIGKGKRKSCVVQ
ncbi:hypothetical protein B0A55_00938 [Friedmanniomyces simplex]|uniref:Uncharacterized protein n=1 Tax=Friedmanniomyces simplex TaxID=329884 RepID=A0A4U0XYJ9_9PEZI|nr:hypothetical protein B0A55_00938 [Friedmanniomyces simplex]